MKKNAIFWIREDFRIENNPALSYASQNHDTVIALFMESRYTARIHLPGKLAPWHLNNLGHPLLYALCPQRLPRQTQTHVASHRARGKTLLSVYSFSSTKAMQ